MGKFTNEERTLIKNIVATLTIKRIPDPEIIKEIYQQTHKTISRITLYQCKKSNQEGILSLVQNNEGRTV